MKEQLPLFDHALDAPTAFSPEALVEAIRADRRLSREPISQVCVLELDGDLTDWLVSTGAAHPWESWACFHTSMFSLEVDGFTFGIVPRTIGGPYAVLVAEQMAISGAHLVLGLTSAGGVSSAMPVPGLVAVTSAIRDEGTSYHYLPPAQTVDATRQPRWRAFLSQSSAASPFLCCLDPYGPPTPRIAKRRGNWPATQGRESLQWRCKRLRCSPSLWRAGFQWALWRMSRTGLW
jgi:hypothetical protein